jgi:TonB family protein
VVVKVCVDPAGTVSRTKVLKSSGYAAYDRSLEREMTRWTFKPYILDGRAVEACSARTFIYKPT